MIQLILPHVFRCDECGKWLADDDWLVLYWYEDIHYFDYVSCKLRWRKRKILELGERP